MVIDQIQVLYEPWLFSNLDQDINANFYNVIHSSVFQTKLELIYEPNQWKYYTFLLSYYNNSTTYSLLHKLVLVLMENHYEDHVVR